HEDVRLRAGENAHGQFVEDAFTEHVLELLSEHNEADGADVVPSVRWESRGSMPAAKLNAWGLSGDGATLDLFVSLYYGTDAAKDSLTTVRLFFLPDGVVRSLDVEEEPVGELEVRYVVWDLEKLSRLRVGHREVIELDFVNDYDGPISCLETTDATGEYRTFL